MTALTSHLRPAPYPYGLLTLRLLGKLGGKNRLWLGEAIPVPISNVCVVNEVPVLAIRCEWNPTYFYNRGGEGSGDEDSTNSVEGKDAGRFALPLPLERAVSILRAVSCASSNRPAPSLPVHRDVEVSKKEQLNESLGSATTCFPLQEPDFLSLYNSTDVESVDLSRYCGGVLADTKHSQACAALRVIRCGLFAVIDCPEGLGHYDSETAEGIRFQFQDSATKSVDFDDMDVKEPVAVSDASCREHSVPQSAAFKRIISGLFYASQISYLRDEARTLLMGLSVHMFLLSETHRKFIFAIDGGGKCFRFRSELAREDGEFHHGKGAVSTDDSNVNAYAQRRQVAVVNGKIQPLPPFGIFRLTGPLKNKVSPFLVNEVLVDMLCKGQDVGNTALDIIEQMVHFSQQNALGLTRNDILGQPGAFFFESLVASLLSTLFAATWPCRTGLYRGIVELLRFLAVNVCMGPDFVALFEFDLIHAALFSIKDCPRECPIAAREALGFYFNIWTILYGELEPRSASVLTDHFAIDPNDVRGCDFRSNEELGQGPSLTCGTNYKNASIEEGRSEGKSAPEGSMPCVAGAGPSAAVCHLLLTELSSSKQLLR